MQEEDVQDDDITMQDHVEGKDDEKMTDSTWTYVITKYFAHTDFFADAKSSFLSMEPENKFCTMKLTKLE